MRTLVEEGPAPEPVRRAIARYGTIGDDGAVVMSSVAFASLCRDCGLIDERLASFVNIIFARVTRPEFVMDTAKFMTALALIAKRRECVVNDVHAALTGALDQLPEPLSAPHLREEAQNGFENEPHVTIEEALASGDTVLLKGQWLLGHCRSGRILPRRRDLPEDAVWPVDRSLKMVNNSDRRRSTPGGAVIVAVSCFWLALEHPDPQGQHLRALGQGIQDYLGNGGTATKDVAVFWDYACLAQEEQSESVSQKVELERGLARRALWHTSPMVEVWILVEDAPGVSACVKGG